MKALFDRSLAVEPLKIFVWVLPCIGGFFNRYQIGFTANVYWISVFIPCFKGLNVVHTVDTFLLREGKLTLSYPNITIESAFKLIYRLVVVH